MIPSPRSARVCSRRLRCIALLAWFAQVAGLAGQLAFVVGWHLLKWKGCAGSAAVGRLHTLQAMARACPHGQLTGWQPYGSRPSNSPCTCREAEALGCREDAPERRHCALPHGAARRADRAPVPASGARAATEFPALPGIRRLRATRNQGTMRGRIARIIRIRTQWAAQHIPCHGLRLLVQRATCIAHVSSPWGAQVYASLCRDAADGGEPAPPLWRAFTYELCAGLVDKTMTLPEIAAEEVGALPCRLGPLFSKNNQVYLSLVDWCPNWL